MDGKYPTVTIEKSRPLCADTLPLLSWLVCCTGNNLQQPGIMDEDRVETQQAK